MLTNFRKLLLQSVIVFLPACAAQSPEATRIKLMECPAPEPVSLEGWKSETFPLPPAFAPDFPSGTESLRFAPGWRDPKAEGFWSYAFVLSINEPAPDAPRIRDLLEKYYNGLLASFAADQHKDIAPAQISVVRTAPNHYEAKMRLTDAFATFQPIDVRALIVTVPEADAASSVRVQLSPQAEDHAIWRSLNAAVSSMSPRDAAGAKPDLKNQ